MSVPRLSRRAIVVALSLALLLAAACAGSYAAGRATSAPAATRTVIGQTDHPRGAPGRTMALSRVTVPAGAKLAWHHHPGTQLSRIEAGVLTYTVGTGRVRVMRGDPGSGDVRRVRTIRAGQTARLRAGGWIVEQAGEIHRAANRGDRSVKITIATLLRTGAPAAIPARP